MDKITMWEMLRILNIQRKNCVDLGSIQAKTNKIFLNDQDSGNKEQNAYYNGFAAMAERLLSVNDLILIYNPIKEEHSYVERVR